MFGANEVLLTSDIPAMELSPAWKESLWNIPRVIFSLDPETGAGSYKYNYMMYIFCAGGGGMAVLRAFRLVRLVKFVRNFPEVTKQFTILMKEKRGEVDATITAAEPLNEETKKKIANAISARLGKDKCSKVNIHDVVDPTLIAGLRVEYKDVVIDNTIASKISRRKELMEQVYKEALSNA